MVASVICCLLRRYNRNELVLCEFAQLQLNKLLFEQQSRQLRHEIAAFFGSAGRIGSQFLGNLVSHFLVQCDRSRISHVSAVTGLGRSRTRRRIAATLPLRTTRSTGETNQQCSARCGKEPQHPNHLRLLKRSNFFGTKSYEILLGNVKRCRVYSLFVQSDIQRISADIKDRNHIVTRKNI